jgi:urease accessory protein
LSTLDRATSFRHAGRWPRHEASDSVTLDFDRRHRRRLRLATDSGAELLLDLPKAAALAAGDGLRTEAGAWIEVRAAEEPLLEVTCGDAHRLLRLAWHVGNRHVPAEIGAHAIRIRPDHVIAAMLRGLGAEVCEVVAPFQPEGGAYAEQGGQGHGHHDHAHPRVHGHDHEH